MKNKNSLVLLLGFTAVLLWWSGSHDISYGRSEAFKENIYDPGKLKPTDSLLKVKVGDRAPDFALPYGAVADKFGVLRSDGVSERALFVIDKGGIIRYIDVHDINKRPRMGVLVNELEKLGK